MTQSVRNGLLGCMFVDLRRQAIFATGVGREAELGSLAADAAWLERTTLRRLVPVTVAGRGLVIVACALPDGTLLLFCEPGTEAVMQFVGSVDFAYDIINHLVSDPFDAMTVVDAEARVAYISPVHERFFGMARGDAIGRPVRDVIENTGLDRVVRTGKAEIGHLQRMKGAERVVSRIAIQRDGQIVGAVGRVMFKGPEQVETLSRRVRTLEREVEFYKREAAVLRERRSGLDAIVGSSPAIRRVRADIAKVAPLDIPVLVCGDSGTGKELVAHALHRMSSRRDGPLVAVNAAALPASLVEAELFGYEAGAFTGADRKGRKGKFEQAAGGTIFLDEIGDMPMEVQAKLLRVLQDRMVERVGGERPREVDFRFVSATNSDLKGQVDKGRFRLDLYYRISPIVIEVPPLRNRREDIPELAAHFAAEVAHRHARPALPIGQQAMHWLTSQGWPGNVRQLRHEIERAFVFAEGEAIEVRDFQHGRADDREIGEAAIEEASSADLARRNSSLRSAIGYVEDQAIRAAMERHKGNKKRVAEELGISRSYLYKKLSELSA